MEIVVDASGTVRQYGDGIAVPDGCTLMALDAAQEAAMTQALAQPSSGLTFQNGAFAVLPPPPPPPPPPNANQALISALMAIPSSDGGFNVAQTVISVLAKQPPVPAV